VQVWDTLTGKELNVLNGHTLSVTSAAFSTDSTCVVSCSEDKSVRVWDMLTSKELHVLNGHTHCIKSVAFLTDSTCIVSGSENKLVQEWHSMEPHYIREQAKNSSHDQPYTRWLLSADGQAHLIFVLFDAQLPDSSDILTIPHSTTSSIGFNNVIGPRWHDSYHP